MKTAKTSEAWENYHAFLREKHDGLTYHNQQKPINYRYDLHSNRCKGETKGIPFPEDVVGFLKHVKNPRHPQYAVRNDMRWDSRFLKHADDDTIAEARCLYNLWVSAWVDALDTYESREKWLGHFPFGDDRFGGNRNQAAQLLCNYYGINNEHPTHAPYPDEDEDDDDGYYYDRGPSSKIVNFLTLGVYI